jgi:D-glycero-D-manno-heptose 1,7-bisphosphate phosphatase
MAGAEESPEMEAGNRTLQRAVFLDRDGTLIEEADYLSNPDDVRLIPGAVEALELLREAGFALVLVTNQSGIARGYYSLDDYEAVASRLDDLLAEHRIRLDDSRFCPHHPEFTGECLCRKPSTGMHREASDLLGLDPSLSFFVGDKIRDLLPALELGGEGILVRTGHGRREEEGLSSAFAVVDDLLEAARFILKTI